jgi:hypothetical protein
MRKSFIMITASALSLAFVPSRSFGYQKPNSPAVSAQQSRADARKAANDAKDAAQKAADAGEDRAGLPEGDRLQQGGRVACQRDQFGQRPATAQARHDRLQRIGLLIENTCRDVFRRNLQFGDHLGGEGCSPLFVLDRTK